MKRLIGLSVIALALAIFTSASFAQEKIKTQVKSQVKTQVQAQSGINGQQARTNWVDLDGDGICDNFNSANRNMNGGKGFGMQNRTNGGTMGRGNARGFGDGSGLHPQDGTGFGYKNGGGTGTGVCDGTGPKGNAKGRNK